MIQYGVNFQCSLQLDLSLANSLMNKHNSKDLIHCKSSFCRIATIQSAKRKDEVSRKGINSFEHFEIHAILLLNYMVSGFLPLCL